MNSIKPFLGFHSPLCSLLYFIVYFLPLYSLASLERYFGTTPFEQGALGGCYYAPLKTSATSCPSLLAYDSQFSLTTSVSYLREHRPKLTDIVLNNEYLGEELTSGDYQLSQIENFYWQMQGVIPLKFLSAHSLVGFGLTLPQGQVVDISIPSPDQPQALSHANAYGQVEFRAFFAQSWNKLSASVAMRQSFHADIQSSLVTAIDTSQRPSQLQLNGKVKNSPAWELNATYQFNQHNLFTLSYDQEQKFQFHQQAKGISPLGSASTVDYQFEISATPIYRPEQYRIQWQGKIISQLSVLLGLNYQRWHGWQGPSISIKNASGIISESDSTENFASMRNRIIPRASIIYHPHGQSEFILSYQYQPNSIEQQVRGNKLDSPQNSYALAHRYHLNPINNTAVAWEVAASFRRSNKRYTAKNPVREDGEPGQPIGYPGYAFQGHIFSVSTGLGFYF